MWETDEFLYHTWHPGSDGVDNYMGPHDGRNMSTTALQTLCSGRVDPWLENPAIQRLRTGQAGDVAELLIDPAYRQTFQRPEPAGPAKVDGPERVLEGAFASYHGYDVYESDGSFYAAPQDLRIDLTSTTWREDDCLIMGQSFREVQNTIDAQEARSAGSLTDVERRLRELELQISGIYQSRTWRALTWMGGMLSKMISLRRRA